jgi:hypothetical protein
MAAPALEGFDRPAWEEPASTVTAVWPALPGAAMADRLQGALPRVRAQAHRAGTRHPHLLHRAWLFVRGVEQMHREE